MATVDLGKIKFNWTGAYADTTSYEADDVVQYGGDVFIYIGTVTPAAYDAAETYDDTVTNVVIGSDNKIYRYINATPSDGNDPTVSPLYWEVNEPGTTSPATTYWDLMVEGTSTLTTQGDLATHDGTNTIRLPIGSNGEVLTVSGNDLTYSAISAMQGRKYLQKNYDNVVSPSAANTYGASGSRAWLADYDNDWIPECGISNPAMSPVSWWDGNDTGCYRKITYLNENHEVIVKGTDSYYWAGNSAGNAHGGGIKVNVSPEFGGLEEGEYFVRIWCSYSNIYCVTNKGGLFAAGYNGYGQLGVGDTTDRYNLVRVPAFGEGRTHGSGADNGMRIAGFHVNNGGNGYGNYHKCFAIDENGRLFAWGHNGNGQLGVGNTTNQTRPQEVTAVSNVTQVHTSYLTTFVVDADGDLYNTGYNANGILGGVTISANTTTFTQVSGASNVYQFAQTTHTYYTSSWTYVGVSHYLNTNGELYGSGEAGNGQLGDGTTSDKNAYTRIGGSQTFSSIYYAGMSRDNSIYCLGGTPGSSNKDIYVHGYNGNGQLGDGTTTNATSPKQPSTTTIYSFTSASTAADSAPTTTAVSFPRDDIEEIFPIPGMQGQSTSFVMCIDNVGKVWRSGYTQSLEYWQNNTNNTSKTNFRLEPGMFNTAETTTGKFWLGEVQRDVVAFRGMGNIYNSEGLHVAYFDDGTILAQGYNGQGTIDSNEQYIGNWNQIN
jgi:alpha-tubulin suppressor-like RCC1 family protein